MIEEVNSTFMDGRITRNVNGCMERNVGLLLCILAVFSLAELAYGETLDDVLNYQYQYSTADQD